jgi:hypothetical protein
VLLLGDGVLVDGGSYQTWTWSSRSEYSARVRELVLERWMDVV